MTQACAVIFLILTNVSIGTNGRQQEVDELREEISSTEPNNPTEKESRLYRTNGVCARPKADRRAGMALRNQTRCYSPIFVRNSSIINGVLGSPNDYARTKTV